MPFHVNAYGSRVIRDKGGVPGRDGGQGTTADPPGPSPARCLALGQALVAVLGTLPHKVALVATSSWSHAFLTEKTGFMHPDLAADRERFEELRTGAYAAWRRLSRGQLESCGQQELLNWMPLAGAMTAAGAGPPRWCQLAESYIMNSSKCSVVFRPVELPTCGRLAGPGPPPA